MFMKPKIVSQKPVVDPHEQKYVDQLNDLLPPITSILLKPVDINFVLRYETDQVLRDLAVVSEIIRQFATAHAEHGAILKQQKVRIGKKSTTYPAEYYLSERVLRNMQTEQIEVLYKYWTEEAEHELSLLVHVLVGRIKKNVYESFMDVQLDEIEPLL